MYELFILGELLDQPMYGYLLQKVIGIAIGPVRRMSWGALYPLVRRLEEEGLITAADGACERSGRPRKIYSITEAGRERFHQLMLEPAPYDMDYADLFNIKLVNFDHLTRDEQRTILEHHRGYVRLLREYMQRQRRRVASACGIPEGERPQILRATDHRLCLVAADEAWIEREIGALNDAPEETA
jgi:DNA-binding PadR family transcriptional regulator